MNSTSQSVVESTSLGYNSDLQIAECVDELSPYEVRMDGLMEQTAAKANQPPVEKEVQPKEKPDTGLKQDQRFPERPDEGEAKPVPDMAPPEQGDN